MNDYNSNDKIDYKIYRRVHMETLEVRNIELSGTNYEIGYKLGELVANMPEIIEGQINKSNLVSKKKKKRC